MRSWISKKAFAWWRKSANHWMWLYENRLPRRKITTSPADECRLWAMSNGGSSHAQESRAKNSTHQRINSKTIMNRRLSILPWETLTAEISNPINNLLWAIGNITGDLENLLITPNRLWLGRNNDRSPMGPLNVSNNPKTFLKCNEQIFNVWFENWLITQVPKLIHKPKWFDNDLM